jgi:hypothetical protein
MAEAKAYGVGNAKMPENPGATAFKSVFKFL